MDRVYLDHAATTPVREEVLDAMRPWLLAGYNPSSLHAEGRAARAAIDDARETIAALCGALPEEIVFTGGGSESDNLALLGHARACGAAAHLVVSALEHEAVLRAAERLEDEGWSVTRLAPGPDGVVDPGAFAAALTPRTALASVMLASNELGTRQPAAALAALAHACGARFHTDAVQAAAWCDLAAETASADLVAISAHKLEGPKGVGALVARGGVPLAALILGGGQERGRRAGTENVAGIVGLAAALRLAARERERVAARVAGLHDRLERGLRERIPGLVVLGAGASRLPHVLAVAIPDAPSDALLAALDLEGIAASAGSACAAGSLEPSRAAVALGLPPPLARGVIRFSLGRRTTDAEIDRAITVATAVAARARAVPTVR